jgi:hypothetical protein
MIFRCMMTGTRAFSLLLFLLVFTVLFVTPIVCRGDQAEPTDNQQSAAPAEEFRRFKFVFEPDAYYTDLDLIISLTKAPIPHLGEMTESEIYGALLSRAAVLPQFMVVEASINPMPYLGTYIRKHDPSFYDGAQVSGSFNWVKALTAGFEEPWAFSILAGNVANFRDPGSKDTKGLGYSGYLFSAGNYHIKDNVLIKDDWREFEWKIKGDRKSPVKKLSWSFRVGAKLHGNPDITDIIYLSVRRSRVDYQPEETSLFNNSGFEYTYDMDRRNLNGIRHYFLVDKKWPFGKSLEAFSLAFGFVWESAKKYTGELAAGREKNDFQVILRPNIEF